MSAVHRRAARREQQAADLLGAERVKYRPRFTPSPDVTPIILPDGQSVQADSKTRKRLPQWIVGGLAQCKRYSPDSVPLIIASETGGPPIAILPARDLLRLLGLAPPEPGQLALGVQP